MLHRPVVGLIFLLCITSAFAKDSGPNSTAVANANMQEVAPGDHWTYEVRDEIAGTLKLTRTDMVTDVSKNEIAVRYDVSGTGNIGNILYDRSWNIVGDGPFRYKPNDGTGFQFPLKLGAQWKFAIDAINSKNGQTFRRVGDSRVTRQENITTKAGTFDTFVIETNYTGKNVQDITLINQTATRTWFSLDVNHWVRRNIVWRQRGHIVQNTTIELTDYGRKKQ